VWTLNGLPGGDFIKLDFIKYNPQTTVAIAIIGATLKIIFSFTIFMIVQMFQL